MFFVARRARTAALFPHLFFAAEFPRTHEARGPEHITLHTTMMFSYLRPRARLALRASVVGRHLPSTAPPPPPPPRRCHVSVPCAACYSASPFASAAAAAAVPDAAEDNIIITKRCATQLKRLVDKGTAAEPRLRLSVESGGCSGFSYKFDVDDADVDDEDDFVFSSFGAEVVVDETSFEFVKGSTVDYEQELIRSGFAVLNNPNSESGCGCGVSFTAKLD